MDRPDMKKITLNWLKKHKACCSLDDMQKAAKLGTVEKICDCLMSKNRFLDANWLITRSNTKAQNQKYAIFAAKQVLLIFEKKYPDDKRPCLAIEAAEKYLKYPTKGNKEIVNAAYAAAAAAAAADAYDAAADAYDAAADAAYAAAYAAAADAAAAAAYAAAAYAAAAYDADANKLRIKIIKYGINLQIGEKQ